MRRRIWGCRHQAQSFSKSRPRSGLRLEWRSSHFRARLSCYFQSSPSSHSFRQASWSNWNTINRNVVKIALVLEIDIHMLIHFPTCYDHLFILPKNVVPYYWTGLNSQFLLIWKNPFWGPINYLIFITQGANIAFAWRGIFFVVEYANKT